MSNMLLEKVEYKTEVTALGTWKRHVYPDGRRFAEFRSHVDVYGWPLLHYTYGICPETGRHVVARGVIAVGRIAVGVVALGHVAAGLVAVGQGALGIALGLGQAASGWWCIGQLALGGAFGLGQLATGATAIGQLALGTFVLAQAGWGAHVWAPGHADPAAVEHFRALLNAVAALFG